MFSSEWESALIDIDRGTEFSGDDVDRFSELVDLGAEYENLCVFIPTIDSGVVSVYVQRDGESDTVPVIIHVLDDDATGSFAHSTTDGTGGIVVNFELGAIRYLRMHVAADQDPDVTFYVRGYNRVIYGT